MFNTKAQWDESATRVLNLCREIAGEVSGNFVGTESLLLALVKETPFDEHRIEMLHFEAVLSTIRWAYTPPEVLSHPCDSPRLLQALEAAAKRAKAGSRPVIRRDLWHG